MKTLRKTTTVFAALFLSLAMVRIFCLSHLQLGCTMWIWAHMNDNPPELNTPEMQRMIAEIQAQMPSVQTVSTWTAQDGENVRGYLHKRLITTP